MARLDSIPEIVQVLDHFPEHNTAYIVMEFLEGRTLKEVVAQSGPIPADTMLALLEPVLRAMEAMHQAGVIHRDISPDNLMELKDGTVKLMDFGCARDFQSGLTETITLKHGFAPGAVLRPGSGPLDRRVRPVRHGVLLPHREGSPQGDAPWGGGAGSHDSSPAAGS